MNPEKFRRMWGDESWTRGGRGVGDSMAAAPVPKEKAAGLIHGCPDKDF